MIAFFRSNQVSTVLVLAFYSALLHLPGLLGWVSASMTDEAVPGILYQYLFAWANSYPLFSAIGATVLVLIQGLLINWLINESKVTQERNWIQAMIYVFVASAVPDFQFLSPALLAVTTVPLALRKIFKVYKSTDTSGLALDAGFWVGVGALFYPPLIWLVIPFFLGFNGIKVLRLNEQVVFVVGCLLPLFLAGTWAFWQNEFSIFMQQHVTERFQFWNTTWLDTTFTWTRASFMLLLILIVLVNSGNYYYKKLMQVQKYINTLYWLLIMVPISAFFSKELFAEHFVLAAPSVGILLGMSFQNIRNPLLAELLHFLLLLCAAALLFSMHL